MVDLGFGGCSVGWMAKIISMVGASLEFLSMATMNSMVGTDRLLDEFYDAIDFDYFPNLQSITFDYLCDYQLVGPKSTRHIPLVLRKITSSSVREVILTLADNRYSLDTLYAIDWASISEVLSQKNYSSLERFFVLRVNSRQLDEAVDITMDGMKGLTEKNPSVGIFLCNQRQLVMAPRFGW
ncbi:hypothetical protein EV421DRAFT_1827727 [Armillaria borealis]|uniref:Uncharacterized protein n=1 Tax=Armillaria borealis TaxID=47425 RepID=A0AA39MLC7_9AGAR|nr:hypothetical protein EV421DRAFT_1827727 [Armillaria borealis]